MVLATGGGRNPRGTAADTGAPEKRPLRRRYRYCRHTCTLLTFGTVIARRTCALRSGTTSAILAHLLLASPCQSHRQCSHRRQPRRIEEPAMPGRMSRQHVEPEDVYSSAEMDPGQSPGSHRFHHIMGLKERSSLVLNRQTQTRNQQH